MFGGGFADVCLNRDGNSITFLNSIPSKQIRRGFYVGGVNSRLRKRVLIAMLLYLIVLITPTLIPTLTEHTVLHFIVGFGSATILWLLVVPFGLHLPNRCESFNHYLDSICMSRIRPLSRNLVLGGSCALVFFLFTLTASLLTGNVLFDLNQLLPPNSWALLTALRPAIWEEVAFRGVLLTVLLQAYPKRTAILLDAGLFGTFHFINLVNALTIDAIILTSFQVLYTFFFGLAFAYLFVKTASLLPGILAHYLVDALAVLF